MEVQMSKSTAESILDQVIAEHEASPVDMLGIGDAGGEYAYLKTLRDSYARTVADVRRLHDQPRAGERILELGSFLGPVCITLKRLGYDVSAADIPEFHDSASLRDLYHRNGVPFDGVNLRHAQLPYGSESMDLVILCEVLEHLNFNPLPALAEINRVLKPGGHLYIGMPNQASIVNRIKLLFGRSIHNPIQEFFTQLDRNSNMIVGLHWREYTMAETHQLMECMGFDVVGSEYYANSGSRTRISTWLLRKILYLWPSFRPFLVVVGKKRLVSPSHDFHRVEANS